MRGVTLGGRNGRKGQIVPGTSVRTSFAVRSSLMKALISALALLSFVAASTIPYVAQAQTNTTHQTTHKKSKKKHVAKAKKTHKSVSKKKKTAATPKAG
jgi:hypothetical protein